MKKIFLAILGISLFFASFAIAQEQPHNDPLDIISNRPRPNVLMIMDTSGSMLWDSVLYNGNAMPVRKENNRGASSTLRSNYYNLNNNSMTNFLLDSENVRSRSKQAKDAVREILTQIPDVNVGIGQFNQVLKLNRFRAYVPNTLNQTSSQDSNYYYYYWGSYTPGTGEINIPYRRKHKSTGVYEYPYCKIVRRDSGAYWSWDATDVVWSRSSDNTKWFDGVPYIRMNWDYSYVENARREMFWALNSDGDYIWRGTSSPNDTHPYKLNNVTNIDIFLTDEEFLELKANTTIGQPLVITRYVESAYGVEIDDNLTFYYFPTTADYNSSSACSGGKVLVGIANRFLQYEETPTTGVYEKADNLEELLSLTGHISTNAKIYDFTAETPELLKNGPFFGMGNTPLGDTLSTAKAYFEDIIITRDQNYAVDHCRENYIIMLTDGLETCGGDAASVAATLYNDLGIKVYVIAFITNPYQANQIAAAGGTEEAFSAENKDELVEALKDIFAEIKVSVELSAPVAVTAGGDSARLIEGNVSLLPFFDFPGFKGRLQARRLFRNAMVEVDPKTGAIVTDGSGYPTILVDDLTEEQVNQAYDGSGSGYFSEPIESVPDREIVGLQDSPPKFMWEAGEKVSKTEIKDRADVDGDDDVEELINNTAYKSADSRRIITTLNYTGSSFQVIDFDEATLVDSSGNYNDLKALLDLQEGTDEEKKLESRFLVNWVRGKQVVRFTEATTLYGHNFAAGDPVPDPDSDDNNNDGIPDGYKYTERKWKLGDIISSSPILVRAPTGNFPIYINDNEAFGGAGSDIHDYEEYKEAHKDNPSLVVVGANDGMLHAYSLDGIDNNNDGDFTDSGDFEPGEEVWAFVIPDLMYKLKDIYGDSDDDDDFAPDEQQLDPHTYFLDGQVTLSLVRARIHDGDTDGDNKTDDPEFRTIMLFGEGRGGKRIWCFDMTDPMNPQPVWSTTHATMGHTISRPASGAMAVPSNPSLDNDAFKYFVVAGSGFDYTQTDGSATVGNKFYMFNINDGSIEKIIDAGDSSGGANIPNAIVSRAILVDDDDDYLVERAYYADLDGNIWRWDLNSSTAFNVLGQVVSSDVMLNGPIIDSITYANIFGFHIITAATGGDTRRYLNPDKSLLTGFAKQRIYMLVDTNREGDVESLLNGEFTYSETDGFVYNDEAVSTKGVDLPDTVVAENQPVVATFTEYDEEGKIYRGFQTFYPTYTPDPAGLRSIRCSFGNSNLLIFDSIFSENSIVASTSAAFIDMGEGKATGITYTGGNILFSIGDQFKVYGSGVYRFESSVKVKARLKVLSWKEVF